MPKSEGLEADESTATVNGDFFSTSVVEFSYSLLVEIVPGEGGGVQCLLTFKY